MTSKDKNIENTKTVKKKCGIIMPIAPTSEYPKEHWKEVLNILAEAISETEFEARLVSDDVAIGLIHERIVNNIYNDEIVVCDVSSKNPNVMFELGLRLAFDKPTIIIKDEKTGYSFDTGVIEHLNYPSSLRFNNIVDFKKELVKKINATYEKSISEKGFSPFLKSFGKTIVPAKINSIEIPESKYIIEKLESISHEIKLLKFKNRIDVESLFDSRREEKLSLSDEMKFRSIVNNFIRRFNHLDKESILKLTDSISAEVSFQTNIFPSREQIVSYIESYFFKMENKLNGKQ